MLQGIAGALFTALALMIPALHNSGRNHEVAAGDVETEIEEMQGKWFGNGPDGNDAVWEVKDTTVSVEILGRHFVTKAKIHPNTVPHAEVDFAIVEPEEFHGKTALGIYTFDKDKGELVLCLGMPDDHERPKKFAHAIGKTMICRLKKMK